MHKMRKCTYDFEAAKEEYIRFCENEDNDIQIFAQPWYLDAVCETPEDWRVIVYKENDRIVAAFPFCYKKGKYGLWHIFNPLFTPRLGIWMLYKDRKKESTREAFENKVVEHIIENLPYFDEMKISFDSRFQNWQQFYRNGFSQTTMYSYIIHEEDEIEALLTSKMRNRIKNHRNCLVSIRI